jgi:hypothetical protein
MKTKRSGAGLRVEIDPRRVSLLASIRTAAAGVPLFVLTGRALANLVAEVGGHDAAAAELLKIATANGRPIGINFQLSRDRSKTVFVSPKGWSEERLCGWIGGFHLELEDEFGDVAKVGSN